MTDSLLPPGKILLIEDDLRLGEQLVPEIVRAGYQCHWLQKGDEGLKAVDTFHPQLILLDLMLPDQTGFAVLAQLRAHSTIPVIVLTAKLLGEDKVKALDLGADDYVTKPFWTDELTARIRAVLRRQHVNAQRHSPPSDSDHQIKANENAHRLRVGQLEVDTVAFTACVEQQPCKLTHTEFNLLQFFLSHPNQALRRERIIDAVLTNEDSSFEALQSHISRLRKKLGVEGHRIKTVWGIGYRLNTDE